MYKIIILPVVFYWCKTWSLALREEHRLKMFENRVLRRIFRPKRDEKTGGLRKLRTEGLHNLHSSPNTIRMIKSKTISWTGHVACMGIRGLYIEFWWESHKGRGHQEDLHAGRIIIKWVLE
jgi:hypothetical protein